MKSFYRNMIRYAPSCVLASLLALCLALSQVPSNGCALAWAEEDASQAVYSNSADPDIESSTDSQSDSDASAKIAQLSEYYLANDGLITPVRLQNPWGSCWAFAIAAALESSILKASSMLNNPSTPAFALQNATDHTEPLLTGLNTDIDISERAIAWFAHELQTEATAGAQAGEGNQRTNADDPTTQMAGGSFTTVEAMLTAHQTIVAESSVPYEYNGYAAGDLPWYALPGSGLGDARDMDWSVPDEMRTQNDIGWEVRDVLRLVSPSTAQFSSDGSYAYQGYNADATQKIKDILAQVGAVAIALSTDTSLPQEVLAGISAQAQPSEHLTYSTWSQYDSSDSFVADHAVAIVGWDDSYSASNFAGTASGQPPADGAWLCKNDWGSDSLFAELGASGDSLKWGIRADDGSATGFFWLSYYDHTISAPTAFTVQPVSAGYDLTYQHDYLSNSEFYVPSIYEQDLWVANVFTAEDTELLEAVSAQTFNENDTVKIRICTIAGESSDAAIFDSARTVYETEETFDIAGFHVIELESPILISKGQRFAIMESVCSGSNPNSRYLNLELAFTTDPVEAGLETFAKVISNEGETYVDLYGEGWTSLADFNTWYSDYCSENGMSVDVLYGNALIKAYSNETTMAKSTEHIYELVELGAAPLGATPDSALLSRFG